MTVALRAEIVTDGAAFEGMRPRWQELWRRCPSATPFQSPAWLLPWWKHFAPGELAVIAVSREARLVGLAPFYIEDGSACRRLLPVGISLSDYLEVLIEPGCERDAAELIFEAGLTLGWDRWEFEELRPEAQASALACPPGMTDEAVMQSACPVIVLKGGEDLAGCVPAGKVRKLRHAMARAARRGTVEIGRVTRGFDGFIGELARLQEARWSALGERGVLDDRAARNFHREALSGLAAQGMARCYEMRIGGTLAALHYGFADRTRVHFYLGGFDPAFGEASPGTILIGHAIAEALREGAAEFHFLRGAEPYKYDWGAADRWNRKRSFRRAAA